MVKKETIDMAIKKPMKMICIINFLLKKD